MADGNNGLESRDANGRFRSGNSAALGRRNPHAVRVAEWRRALVDAVSDEDLRDVLMVLVRMAKGGDMRAIGEVLDRCLGRPDPSLLAVQLRLAGEMESAVAAISEVVLRHLGTDEQRDAVIRDLDALMRRRSKVLRVESTLSQALTEEVQDAQAKAME